MASSSAIDDNSSLEGEGRQTQQQSDMDQSEVLKMKKFKESFKYVNSS